MSINEWDNLVCDHSAETALRSRVQSNGMSYICRQCLTCGINLGAVSKSSPQVLLLASIDPFDEMIAISWREQCAVYREDRQQEMTQERHAAYTAYLATDAWARKRALVLKRAGGICEGCGINRPVQVHHLTYEHLGDEFLWELKAVCLPCHRKAHPEKDEGR